MLKRPAAALGLSAASLLLLGGVAYGAVQAINTQPPPQVVIPATSQSSVSTATPSAPHGGADDPATHDVADDHGGAARSTPRASSDDGATHDAGDDHGGGATSSSGRGGADDPATHDATDDHGGTSGRSGSDSSSGSGSGRDSGGGSGSGGHGSDG
jgi:hypothetical protein